MTDAKLLLFNEQFPNSNYREIKPQSTTGDPKDYQDSKAPLNNNIVKFDNIKDTNNRIGWIVPKEYIVVDLDNKNDARIVYEILVNNNIKFSYMTGLHGGHFIFKNPKNVGQGTKFVTSIGIKIDTRCLEKGYIILPYNDTDRGWGNITNDVDDLPFFLTPIRDKEFKLNVDFVTMTEGSRNTELLKHFLNLKDYCSELTLEEKIQSIKLINKFVLREGLSDKELQQTVLRDAIVNKVNEKAVHVKKVNLEAIASRIVEDKALITVNDTVYIYNGKYYEIFNDTELERFIHENYNKELEQRHRKEIINFIKLKTYVAPKDVNKNWNEIVVRNGILNISNLTLYPHTPLKYNTIYIDYDFKNPANYSSIIDNFMNQISVGDEGKKQLLYEIIGYCFVQRCVFSKFFVLYGEGQTGKSTYLRLIKNLIGKKNSSFLVLRDLEKEFMPAELFGKLVNIGDDIPYDAIKDTSILKSLVSGEEITARKIYGNPFSFTNFATLIFTTNKLPSVADKSSGFYRRFTIVDIDKKIEEPDPFFMDKVQEKDYEYLFYKSIMAVREAIKNNKMTSYQHADDNMNSYRMTQSSVLIFLNDMDYSKTTLDLKPTREIYEQYKQYCQECGYKSYNKCNFQSEVCAELKMGLKCTTLNGENQQWRFTAHR
mgnify:CR=1 FL=1